MRLFTNPPYKFLILLSLFLFFSLSSLLLHQYYLSMNGNTFRNLSPSKHVSCPSVYIYDLPSKFNVDLVKNCARLNAHRNMCPHVANRGLGQPLSHPLGGGDGGVWFATNQFTAEMIFHARMENHPCRTKDPALAHLFYVPFYGGFHMSSNIHQPNYTARDELATQLADHIKGQPWWHRQEGKDHFMVLGRIGWDFTRPGQERLGHWFDYGPNNLLKLPTVKNMSVLLIERNLRGSIHNEHGIPYPSYFHPYTAGHVASWQQAVRKLKRPYLFSFIGARRTSGKLATIRDNLMRQCNMSKRCVLLDCTRDASKCDDPEHVVSVMKESRFCLQPHGDSFTRRGLFDSILAGCIPVVFSPNTAYTQYEMYLPTDTASYSVFLKEEEGMRSGKRTMNVEKELRKIGRGKVREMMNVVVDLIPRLTFAHPNASGDKGFEDVVDVALLSLLQRLKI